MFKVLREIGVELTRYHSMSLNGKIDNATHVFDQWALILKVGRREGCMMCLDAIVEWFQEYKSVFLLWDGAFSFARKVNPMSDDRAMFRRFVDAAVDGHCKIGCNITHKIHLMWKHVEWQMALLPGDSGGKMEDWVELQHQWGGATS